MSTNATQQFVDLINTDTGRELKLRDVEFLQPESYSDSAGRNSAVFANALGGGANWGGSKRFRYWRLVINSDTDYVDIENHREDWNTEEKVVLRFSEWLGGKEVFSSDELLISSYQLIGQPQYWFYSVSVRKDNLKYKGSVVFRVKEPVFDWDGKIFELNGFKTIIRKPEG